jgi:hypothetical protein
MKTFNLQVGQYLLFFEKPIFGFLQIGGIKKNHVELLTSRFDYGTDTPMTIEDGGSYTFSFNDREVEVRCFVHSGKSKMLYVELEIYADEEVGIYEQADAKEKRNVDL